MKVVAAVAAVLVTVACGQQTGAGAPGQSARPSIASEARATGVKSSSPGVSTSPQAPSGAYGIRLVSQGAGQNTQLQVIATDGSIAAFVWVAPPSISDQACGQGMGTWLEPPVSASNDKVYYRDGDSKIRMVVPPSSYSDVTAVPGGPELVSSFSVSPDDQRIAVLVEDMSAPNTIAEKLYVEDLHGGGHHIDIYSTATPKGKGATTLWPMGWHQGKLVLSVWSACTFEQVPGPVAWHVVDASTAVRKASIGDVNCVPSSWPSPAGVACVANSTSEVRVYDWTGKLTSTVQTQLSVTALSPSGDRLLGGTSGSALCCPSPTPSTVVLGLDGQVVANIQGHTGCLWIDDSHVLALDGVISLPAGSVTPLQQVGQCVGRLPGGL